MTFAAMSPRPSTEVPRTIAGQGGYMLLALLITLVIGGLAAVRTAEVWSTLEQREKEQQLLFVGEQYLQAIRSYYAATPRGTRELPPTIEALLQDDRFVEPVRHLRQAYPDPFQPEGLQLVHLGGRIMGVYSPADIAPRKHANFPRGQEGFADAKSIRDWKFIFVAASAPWTGSRLPNVGPTPTAPGAPSLPAQPRSALRN